MAQRLHTDAGLTWVTLTPMFCREIILRLMNMSVCLRTAMFIGLRTFLLIHMSIIHLLQGYLLGLQRRNSQMLHLDSLLLSHPWKCGWRRRINFLLQRKVSSLQSKASDTIAGDVKHTKGRMIKWSYYVFHIWIAYLSYCVLIFIYAVIIQVCIKCLCFTTLLWSLSS